MKWDRADKDMVLAVAGTTVSLLGAATFLIYEGKDVTQLLPFLGVLVPMLFQTRSLNRQGKQLNGIERKVDIVDSNVNGHLSDLSKAAGIKQDSPD
jgi:hypothetical protein